MIWANFLHIYQPYNQEKKILEAVVNESYRPLLKGLKNSSKGRVVLNVSGALLELLDNHGFTDVILGIKELGKLGKLEFTGSAKYHAILPLLPDAEIVRQIEANNETNRFYLGDAYNPKGFFPPEDAVDARVARLVDSLGFDWILLDEVAFNGKVDSVDYSSLHKVKDTNLKVFFRNRRVSNLVMSAMVRSVPSLLESLGQAQNDTGVLVTAMDGETFGHHRPGFENFLFEIINSNKFESVHFSDLLTTYSDRFKQTVEFVPVACTWASSEYDLESGKQFLSWNDPSNEIHKMQHEFVAFAVKLFSAVSASDTCYSSLRKKLDIALSSDQFFWASLNPWWSIEMIELGAHQLLEIVEGLPASILSTADAHKANEYYQKIVSTAFNWKRSGKVESMATGGSPRIPFKENTLEKQGSENVYHAFVHMIRDLEAKAVASREYEKAIMWRDALYKLESKTDIYDAVSAIDLVRVEIPNEDVERIIREFEPIYKKMRGGQPEQRDRR